MQVPGHWACVAKQYLVARERVTARAAGTELGVGVPASVSVRPEVIMVGMGRRRWRVAMHDNREWPEILHIRETIRRGLPFLFASLQLRHGLPCERKGVNDTSLFVGAVSR